MVSRASSQLIVEFAFTVCTHAFHWVIQAIGMINTPADGATAQTGAYLMVAVLIAAGIVSFHPGHFIIFNM